MPRGVPQGLLFAQRENVAEPTSGQEGFAALDYAAKAQGAQKAQQGQMSLKGQLYEDKNGNGQKDWGESGEAGLMVEAQRESLTLRAFTREDGSFDLPDALEEGESLEVLLPDHMMLGEANDRMEIPYTVTCLIEGSVTVNGAPLADVLVVVADQQTLTDEAGAYSFGQLTSSYCRSRSWGVDTVIRCSSASSFRRIPSSSAKAVRSTRSTVKSAG